MPVAKKNPFKVSLPGGAWLFKVLASLGYEISNTYIVQIDSKSVCGDEPDVDGFLAIANDNGEVQRLNAAIPGQVATLKPVGAPPI